MQKLLSQCIGHNFGEIFTYTFTPSIGSLCHRRSRGETSGFLNFFGEQVNSAKLQDCWSDFICDY